MFLVIIFVLCSPVLIPAAQFHELKSPSFTIHSEAGLDGAAEEITRMIPPIKEQLQEKTGLAFDFPFEVVVYRERNDFVQHAGSDMISAFAVPHKNLVVLDLSQMRVHPLNIELIILHEMCHLLLHKHIGDENLPKWFDEGVSQWVSGGMSEIINPQEADVLKRAVIGNRLIPLRQLSKIFPPDRPGLALSYEQGKSMVDYIEETYGSGSVRKIIQGLAEGVDFQSVLRQKLSVSFDGLERDWERALKFRYTWFTYLSDNLLWIIFIAGSILVVAGYYLLKKRMRNLPEDEDQEWFE